MLSSFVAEAANEPVSLVLASSKEELQQSGFGRRFFRSAHLVSQGKWATGIGNMVTQSCRTCVGVAIITAAGDVALAHVSDRYADDESRMRHVRSVSSARLPGLSSVLNDTLEESLEKMVQALKEPPVQIITVGGCSVDVKLNFSRNMYLMLYFHNWTAFLEDQTSALTVQHLVNAIRSVPAGSRIKVTGYPVMPRDPLTLLSDETLTVQMKQMLNTSTSRVGISQTEVIHFMAVSQEFVMEDAVVVPRLQRLMQQSIPEAVGMMTRFAETASGPWKIVRRIEAFAKTHNAFFQCFRSIEKNDDGGEGSTPMVDRIATGGMVIAVLKKPGRAVVCIAEEECFEHFEEVKKSAQFANSLEFNAFRGLLQRI